MGKGSGNCTRSALSLSGGSEEAYSWKNIRSLKGLQKAYGESSSQVERICIIQKIKLIHGKEREVGPIENDNLDERAAQVEEDMVKAEEIFYLKACVEVLGAEWEWRLSHDHVKDHPDFVSACQKASDAWAVRPMDDEDDQEREELRKLWIDAVQERDDVSSRVLGYTVFPNGQQTACCRLGGEYVAGELDMEPFIQSQLALHKAEIEAAQEVIEGQYRQEALQRIVNDREGERPSGPAWEEQDLDAITLDVQSHTQSRAVFLQSSLLKDDLLYVDHAPSRLYAETPILSADFEDYDNWRSLCASLDEILPLQEEKTRFHINSDIVRVTEKPMVLGSSPSEAIQKALASASPTFNELSNQEQEKVVQVIADASQVGMKSVWSQGTHKMRAYGEVSPEGEEELIKALLREGARVEDHRLEVPDYKSTHNLTFGKTFKLHVGEGSIQYVPHSSVGTHPVPTIHHQARVDFQDPKTQAHLTEACSSLFDRRAMGEEDIFAFNEQVGGKSVTRLIGIKNNIYEDDLRKVCNGIEGAKKRLPPYLREGKLRKASKSEIEADDSFQQLPDGAYLAGHQYRHWEKKQKIISKDFNRPALCLEWRDQDDETGANYRQQALEESLEGAKISESTQDLLYLYPPPLTQVSSHQTLERKNVPHDGPRSERGQFVVEGLSPQESVQALKKLGACEGVCPEVPYGWAYPNGDLRGRVTIKRPEYEAGLRELTLPEGKMLIHGMTGARSNEDSLERLDKIVGYGGLQSIADRRRSGLQVESLSPIGDIASGIDHGVGCSISNNPSYGHRIFFGLKPEALHRRDVWFSDVDFGGGEDRYSNYNSYAKKIGQENIHVSPSHRSRQKHLNGGTKGGTNETYLRGGVRLDEVDSIFASWEMSGEVRQRVEEWKKQGKLPETVRLTSYLENQFNQYPEGVGKELPVSLQLPSLQEAIKKRADQLQDEKIPKSV